MIWTAWLPPIFQVRFINYETIQAMKRTKSTTFKSRVIAVTFIAVLASIVTLPSASGSKCKDNGFSIAQDTLKYNKAFRTYVTDPADGIEKKIELRYKNDVLADVLIDGKLIKKEDYKKYEKIIDEAEADIIVVNRDTSSAKEEIKRAMEELRAIDFEAIQIFTEEEKAEIRIKIEEARKDIQMDIIRLRESIADSEHWSIIIDTIKDVEFDFDFDSDIDLSPVKKEKMQKRLEELEANTKNGKTMRLASGL